MDPKIKQHKGEKNCIMRSIIHQFYFSVV